MKISVQLVTWNGAEHLPGLFDSLARQSFRDWELLVWDNGSSDATIGVLETEMPKLAVKGRILKQPENMGFAAAHNGLFALSDSPYVFLLNQDVLLEPDTLEKLVGFLEAHPDFGSAAPLLLRLEHRQKTNIVDSLGIGMTRSRRAVDCFSGKPVPDFLGRESVPTFGVSAAAALYRRAAVPDQLFDESYFSYQEDVDLAWYLRLRSFGSAVVIGALAYHGRSVREPEQKTALSAARLKSRQSFFVRYHSYKNHLATIYKNERWQDFVLDWPFILWYEGGKLIYFLLFDRKVLKGLGELWGVRRKLREIRESRAGFRKNSSEIRKWFRD